jgi:hypothetical protein
MANIGWILREEFDAFVIGRKQLLLNLSKSRPITGANRHIEFRFIQNNFGGLLKQFVQEAWMFVKYLSTNCHSSRVKEIIQDDLWKTTP